MATNWSFGVATLTAVTAWFVIAPAAWWLVWVTLGRRDMLPNQRRKIWQRIWWLLLTAIGPPLVGAFVSGERALASAAAPALFWLPQTALIMWLFGAFFSVSYWMRRVCFRVG